MKLITKKLKKFINKYNIIYITLIIIYLITTMAEFSNRYLTVSMETFDEIVNQYKKLLNDLGELQENVEDHLNDVEIDKHYHKIFIRLATIAVALFRKYATFRILLLPPFDKLSLINTHLRTFYPQTEGNSILNSYYESLQETPKSIYVPVDYILYSGSSKLINETTYYIRVMELNRDYFEELVADKTNPREENEIS